MSGASFSQRFDDTHHVLSTDKLPQRHHPPEYAWRPSSLAFLIYLCHPLKPSLVCSLKHCSAPPLALSDVACRAFCVCDRSPVCPFTVPHDLTSLLLDNPLLSVFPCPIHRFSHTCGHFLVSHTHVLPLLFFSSSVTPQCVHHLPVGHYASQISSHMKKSIYQRES